VLAGPEPRVPQRNSRAARAEQRPQTLQGHVSRRRLPEQRFHDFRHYATSFLLAQVVPMRVVMDILGHTQTATTLDLYSHVMPAAHKDVADLLDRAMLAQS
jgi:integrase